MKKDGRPRGEFTNPWMELARIHFKNEWRREWIKKERLRRENNKVVMSALVPNRFK